MSDIKWDDPRGIVGNHTLGTHRYVHGEIGPFAVDAQASHSITAGWSAWHKGGLSVVLMVNLSGRAHTLEDVQNDVEPRLRRLHDDLALHFAPVLRWVDTHRGCVAEIGPWKLSVEKREMRGGTDWWGELKCAGVTLFSCAPAWKDTAKSMLVDAFKTTGVPFRTEDKG